MTTINEDETEIDIKQAQLLTEHFGFQPITVVDDIINIINDIMYKCTEQIERSLIDHKQQLENQAKSFKNLKINEKNEYSLRDIEVGTAKLETTLEQVINKNFDKFELYSLRNVFNIPSHLIKGGYIRLNHHKDLEVIKNIEEVDEEINERYNQLLKEIKFQIERNKMLVESVKKLKKYRTLCQNLRKRISYLNTEDIDNDHDREQLLKLSPLKDTIVFLLNQIREMYDKIKLLQGDKGNGLDDQVLRESVEILEKEDPVKNNLDRLLNIKRKGSNSDTLDGPGLQKLVGFLTET